MGADPTLTNPACFPATATTDAGSLHGTPSCQPNEYPWLDATASGIGTFAGWHKNYDGSGYPVLLPSRLRSGPPHNQHFTRRWLPRTKDESLLGRLLSLQCKHQPLLFGALSIRAVAVRERSRRPIRSVRTICCGTIRVAASRRASCQRSGYSSSSSSSSFWSSIQCESAG